MRRDDRWVWALGGNPQRDGRKRQAVAALADMARTQVGHDSCALVNESDHIIPGYDRECCRDSRCARKRDVV